MVSTKLVLLQALSLANALPFVTTWSTSQPNENLMLARITPQSSVTIDWGDGMTETADSGVHLNHTFASAGLHNVSLEGEFLWNLATSSSQDKLKLVDIVSWGDGFMIDQSFGVGVFTGCSNLKVSAPPNTQPVFLPGASLSSMFGYTSFNSSLNWNLSGVISVGGMFSNTPLNQPITFSDTQDVMSMNGMFYNATDFNQPINFDASNVVDLGFMFDSAKSFNSPVTLTNTRNVINMGGMFSDARAFNQSVAFETDSVTLMNEMFNNAAKFNHPVNFNASQVTTTANMFNGAKEFNQPINFDSPQLVNAEYMFAFASKFNQPVVMDTARVTTMRGMFLGAIVFFSQV